MNNKIIFKQLFEKETSSYTYIIIDIDSNTGIIIDPVMETLARDIKYIKELGFELRYIFETHIHADHITSSFLLKKEFKNAQSVIGKKNNLECHDLKVGDLDVLTIGNTNIQVLETPGHTQGCISYIVKNMIFSGDSLMIRGAGRTDFQGGNSEILYNSIIELFELGDEYLVYPAHDYSGFTNTSIKEEKYYNNCENYNWKNDFIYKMDNLNLNLPENIHFAIPSNMACGKEFI